MTLKWTGTGTGAALWRTKYFTLPQSHCMAGLDKPSKYGNKEPIIISDVIFNLEYCLGIYPRSAHTKVYQLS